MCITRSFSDVGYYEVMKLSERLWSVSLQLVCRRCRNDFFKRVGPACLGCGCGVSGDLGFIMGDLFVVGVCITKSLSGVG